MRNLRLCVLLAMALAAAVPTAGAAPVRAAAHAPSPSPLPWIQDDWPRAVALARARKVPIFVENWAPW